MRERKREREREREGSNSKTKKIIFDFGCNNGQNLSYFLEKAEIVVCVEANTFLTERIKKKFEYHINNNSLFIENVCLSEIDGVKDFYISKQNDILSTLIPPQDKENYQRITIPSMTASNIIKKYRSKLLVNEIEYIKIDVEGYDHIILDDLFKNNIYPKYISAEVHDSMVINLILNSPYKSFKFLEGSEIGNNIKKIEFLNHKQESVQIDFIQHSSGPYGDDIPGKYYARDSIINYFLNNGLGWKDMCCSLEVKEYGEKISYDKKIYQKNLRYHLTEIYPAFKRMLKWRIANIIKK
jgi:FkbM family methyltransferase